MSLWLHWEKHRHTRKHIHDNAKEYDDTTGVHRTTARTAGDTTTRMVGNDNEQQRSEQINTFLLLRSTRTDRTNKYDDSTKSTGRA